MDFIKKHSVSFLAISFIAVELVVGYFAFHNAQIDEQQSLLERAKTVSAALDIHEILALSGNETDELLPEYQELKQQLVRVAEVNADVTSVYVTGFRDGTIFFYADSVASGEVDEATPGLIYDEATDNFFSVFAEGKTIFEGPTADRWGSWVSALVPIIDESTGMAIASIGIDIDSRIYRWNVWMATAVPVLALGVVLLFVFAAYARYQKNKEVLILRSKFVSIASHELRSPVSGLVWAAQSLLSRPDAALSAPARDVIAQMEKTGHQVLRTVGEILELSKLQGSRANKVIMNGVDISLLLREVMQSLALVGQENGVTVRLDDSVPPKLLILCDREKTQRVLSNILTNALKYSSRGGEVVIGYSHEGKRHVFSIKDSGVGIPDAEQGKIFQTNFRASNVERSLIAGTGIGLHLVKELMEIQGGAVRFTSHSGEGTTFFIELKDR